MDDSSLNSSCQIVRIGEVVHMGDEVIVISFNGKEIHIPAAKVERSVQPGDQVSWSGSLWRCKRTE